MSRAGFVLVGGRGRRMGRDKALLPYGGSVLAQFVARTVEAAAGSVKLVGAPDRYGHLGMDMIPDLRPDAGPPGGIEAALAATAAEWNLIVTQALDQGRRAVRNLLPQLRCVPCTAGDGRWLENLNTPRDWHDHLLAVSGQGGTSQEDRPVRPLARGLGLTSQSPWSKEKPAS